MTHKGDGMKNGPIRVLVVDDSAFMRKAIRDMLEQNPLVEVVGTARNGEDALYQAALLKPDVVTVDLFMPEKDGVSFIREQMLRLPLPIVVISSADSDAEQTLRALEAGAIEFVKKPTARALDMMYDMRLDLLRAIQAAGSIPREKLPVPEFVEEKPVAFENPPVTSVSGRIQAVLLAVSTGGPQALRYLLPRLPANLPVPMAVVLHIPPGYTEAIAQKLNDVSSLEVVESGDGVEMRPGRVVLAKAGFHTHLVRRADGMVITELLKEPIESLYVPSADVLFRSGAMLYGDQLLGVVMTGMGNDGTDGSAWIKSKGGLVIAEAESSSVVYGMPRSVVEAGLVDRVASLYEMVEAIMEAL
jgi:two-component system, chemotaxis family, protein-glutamate methylesterase/glutaminase